MAQFTFEGNNIDSGDLESTLRDIYKREIAKAIKITSSKIWLKVDKDAEIAESVERELMKKLLRG